MGNSIQNNVGSDMFSANGKAKPSGKLVVNVAGIKTPTKRNDETTEDKDVTSGIRGNNQKMGDGQVKPVGNPLSAANVEKPREKTIKTDCPTVKEGKTMFNKFKFDQIYKAIFEAEDTPVGVGGDPDAPSANIEGDNFDDTTGDLQPTGDVNDDAGTKQENSETVSDIVSELRSIKGRIEELLAKCGGDEDSDLLDDSDEGEESEEDFADQPAEPDLSANDDTQPPADQPAGQPQVRESWQKKTAFGPKMSDKAPGKLGKKSKSHKCGKNCKRNITLSDGNPKKMSSSKFGPGMRNTVSNIKKGQDLFG